MLTIVSKWIPVPELVGTMLYLQQLHELAKGVGHKYIRRVPMVGKDGKQRYRYYYHVRGGKGVGHEEEVKEKSAFRIKHGDHEGHFHVEETKDDQVKVVHDESGHSVWMSKKAFSEMIRAEHAEAIKEHHGAVRKEHKATTVPGMKKQVAKRAEKYGIKLELPAKKKEPEPEPKEEKSPMEAALEKHLARYPFTDEQKAQVEKTAQGMLESGLYKKNPEMAAQRAADGWAARWDVEELSAAELEQRKKAAEESARKRRKKPEEPKKPRKPAKPEEPPKGKPGHQEDLHKKNHPASVARSEIDSGKSYTLWQKVGDQWVVERTMGGGHIKSDNSYWEGVEKRADSTRPLAFFPQGLDPNEKAKKPEEPPKPEAKKEEEPEEPQKPKKGDMDPTTKRLHDIVDGLTKILARNADADISPNMREGVEKARSRVEGKHPKHRGLDKLGAALERLDAVMPAPAEEKPATKPPTLGDLYGLAGEVGGDPADLYELVQKRHPGYLDDEGGKRRLGIAIGKWRDENGQEPPERDEPRPKKASDMMTEEDWQSLVDDIVKTVEVVQGEKKKRKPKPEKGPALILEGEHSGKIKPKLHQPVGGQIKGSRRELAQLRIQAAKDLEGLSEPELQKVLTKKHLMPETILDLDAHKGGAGTPGAYHMKEWLVKAIAAKPQKTKTSRQVRGWKLKVTSTQSTAPEDREAYVDGLRMFTEAMDACRSVSDVREMIQELRMMTDGRTVISEHADWKEAWKASEKAFGGPKDDSKIYGYTAAVEPRRKADMGPGDLPFLAHGPGNKGLRDETERKMRALGSRIFSLLRSGEDSQSSKSWQQAIEDAKSKEKKGWEGLGDEGPGKKAAQKTRFTWKEEISGHPERIGGRTGQEGVGDAVAMKERFGLEVVDFGNQISKRATGKSDADHHLIACHNAFIDLADVLGMDDKAIALGGLTKSSGDRHPLSMAFGARGKNGKFKAHYEPWAEKEGTDKPAPIINITKFAGGGSLAHEWGHYLDNMLATAALAKQGKGAKLSTIKAAFGSDDPTGFGFEPELEKAMVDLHDAMTTRDPKVAQAARDADKAFRNAYEDLKKVAEAPAGGWSAPEMAWRTVHRSIAPKSPGQQEEKMKAWYRMNDAWGVRGETKARAKGKNASNYQLHAKALDGKGKRESTYSGILEPYWQRGHEMFARAFAAYVQDKLEDNGRRNSYLVDGSRKTYNTGKKADIPHGAVQKIPEVDAARRKMENLRNQLESAREDRDVTEVAKVLAQLKEAQAGYQKLYSEHKTQIAQPSPQGDERKRINAAFDKLFVVLNKGEHLSKAVRSLTILTDPAVEDGWMKIPASLGERFWKVYQHELYKAVGHKYIRRVPYTDARGRRRYRYFYKVTGKRGIGAHEEFVTGAAFKIEHDGQAGHFHVVSVDGDNVEVKHDESGRTVAMPKDELRDLLHREHAELIEAHKGTVAAKMAEEKEAVGKPGRERYKEAFRKRWEEYIDRYAWLGPGATFVDDNSDQPWGPDDSPAIQLHYDLMPPKTVKLDDDTIHFVNPAGKKKRLFIHQQDGAERGLTAFDKGHGFLCQDDAGLGKTLTGLAMLHHLQTKGTVKRALICVPGKGKKAIKTQWKKDAALYGIDVKESREAGEGMLTGDGTWIVAYDHHEMFTTEKEEVWDEKRQKYVKKTTTVLKPHLKDFDMIIMDESHNLAGTSDPAKMSRIAEAGVKIHKEVRDNRVLYLSATPFTNVRDMHYLRSMGWFDDGKEFVDWARKAGCTIEAGKLGDIPAKILNPTTPLPMVTIAAMSHVDGTSIKRTTSLEGLDSGFRQTDLKDLHPDKIPSHILDMHPELQSLHDNAKKTFKMAQKIFALAQEGGYRGPLPAQKVNWEKSYWETLKVVDAIKIGESALEQGKQVGFFTNYVTYGNSQIGGSGPEKGVAATLRKQAEEDEEEGKYGDAAKKRQYADMIDAIAEDLPPPVNPVDILVKHFGGKNKVAEAHGRTSKPLDAEQDAFQQGLKQVMVGTIQKAGTGLSWHDEFGHGARVQCNLGLPWTGTAFVQVAGRMHRLGSMSDTTMHWLIGNSSVEHSNASIVAGRLRSLGSLVSGDPDLVPDAAQLAAWETGIDIDGDELELALEEAGTSEGKGKTEEGKEARDHFRRFAEARHAGRDILAEEYERRKKARVQKVQLAARKLAKLLKEEEGIIVGPHDDPEKFRVWGEDWHARRKINDALKRVRKGKEFNSYHQDHTLTSDALLKLAQNLGKDIGPRSGQISKEDFETLKTPSRLSEEERTAHRKEAEAKAYSDAEKSGTSSDLVHPSVRERASEFGIEVGKAKSNFQGHQIVTLSGNTKEWRGNIRHYLDKVGLAPAQAWDRNTYSWRFPVEHLEVLLDEVSNGDLREPPAAKKPYQGRGGRFGFRRSLPKHQKLVMMIPRS